MKYDDEPDLTYVYSENDLRRLFEVEKEQEAEKEEKDGARETIRT